MVRPCLALALLLLAGCDRQVNVVSSDAGAILPPSQWPPVTRTEATFPDPIPFVTIRASDWLNEPAEVTAMIAEKCGPRYRTARVFRYEETGSPLHPNEMVAYCGDLPLRQHSVYPESGPLSENLSQLNYPVAHGEPGALVTLR